MKKVWNEKFLEYMNFIINHPNYKDLPISKKSDGSYTCTYQSNGKESTTTCSQK